MENGRRKMNKTKNFHTSLYIPKSLWIKVSIIAKSKGKTTSGLITEMLKEKFGVSEVNE